jgi:hypothetical protein
MCRIFFFSRMACCSKPDALQISVSVDKVSSALLQAVEGGAPAGYVFMYKPDNLSQCMTCDIPMISQRKCARHRKN